MICATPPRARDQLGANVKAVQWMLGHASVAMTLDVYAELFDDDLEAISNALDEARAATNVARVLPRKTPAGAEVVQRPRDSGGEVASD